MCKQHINSRDVANNYKQWKSTADVHSSLSTGACPIWRGSGTPERWKESRTFGIFSEVKLGCKYGCKVKGKYFILFFCILVITFIGRGGEKVKMPFSLRICELSANQFISGVEEIFIIT